MRTSKTAFRQDAYGSRCLQSDDALDRLQNHWGVIFQVEFALRQEDDAVLRTAVGELDLDLLRYTLSALKNHLNEAALRDCAKLIAERLLDTAPTQPTIERWKEWLTAAPMWPALAEENWNEAIGWAGDIVLTSLEQDGVVLNEEARHKLLSDMMSLRLRDMLSKSLAQELLPPEPETASGEDDV